MNRILLLLKYFMRKLYSQNKFQNSLRRDGVTIGDDCEICTDVVLGSEPYLISLGDKVRITSGCKFITHDGGVWVLRNKYNKPDIDLIRGIKIGNNVHVGINTIIMPGVTIGDNCIIGCCAVVTKDIPDNSVAAGVPARVIKTIDDYYNKHSKDFVLTKQMDFKNKKKYLLNEKHVYGD